MKRRGRTKLLLVAVCLAVPTTLAMPVADAGRVHAPGPVGWDVYRQLDRLAELPAGSLGAQFSSFDRTGANDDGFTGTYSCLRETSDGCVIAEASGPGEVDAMWFTANIADPGHLGEIGRIRIELDRHVVVDAPLQDLVDGALGKPFVYPLVAGRERSSGGSYVKVPMPFRESMRITTEHRAKFYHVGYRSFLDATGVATFDPDDPATDVVDLLRTAGRRDPKPRAAGTRAGATTWTLDPGESTRIADLSRPATISELAVRLPDVVGPAVPSFFVDDGRATKEGSTQFAVRVDPANEGVRLTRRVDTYWPNSQEAVVTVDGVEVGRWVPLPTTLTPRWVDVTLDIPASVSAGKASLTVRADPTPTIFNGFQDFLYRVDSRVGGAYVRTDELDVGPDSAADEAAHDYRIEAQTWEGRTRTNYAPTGDVDVIAASDEILSGLRLRVTFDGRTTVDSPLGEFFGSGLGEYDVRSLMFAMDRTAGGWYRSWWPMPFRRSAQVELVNTSDRTVRGQAKVSWAPTPANASRLAPPGDLGYFHASSRRGAVTADQDWPLLDASGRGKVVGVSQAMEGEPTSQLTQRGYLEGDERVYVDGARSPAWHGTGTEDFYEGAWYFAYGTFSAPQNGSTAFEAEEFGCALMCDSAYRLLIGEAVPFESSLRFGIEHGAANEWPATYGSTVFWYGRNSASSVTDTLDVGDAQSESAHRFVASPLGAVESLTSVFEGDADRESVTDEGRVSPGSTSFRMAVDPSNRGVVLRRTSDQQVGYQAVRVRVNGVEVGRWVQPLSNGTQRWLEDSYSLPAAVTAGRKHLEVTLTSDAGGPPWHAARYEVLSIVN